MKRGVLAVACVLALPATAHACQHLRLINRTQIPRQAVTRAETAITAQVLQARHWWRGMPCVQWGKTGWRVILEPQVKLMGVVLRGDDGYHFTNLNGRPYAAVNQHDWTVNLSHEVLEMLHNPYGWRREICDRVELLSYRLDGVRVSDFVTPAWYRSHRGQLDYENWLRPDGQLVRFAASGTA